MEPELARGPMLLRRLRDGDFLSECSATLVAYRPIGNDTWRGPEMGWIVAFVVVAVAVAAGVGGTVLHPVLYGLFIAAVLIIPLFLGSSLVGGIIDELFGRRK